MNLIRTKRTSSSVKSSPNSSSASSILSVVDDEGYLVGIVTNRDLRFERDMAKHIDLVMTPIERLVTTNQSTDLESAAQILQKHKIEKLPIVGMDGKLIGLVTYKDITKAKDKPMACKDAKGRLRVAAGVGVTADTLDRMQALVDAGEYPAKLF